MLARSSYSFVLYEILNMSHIAVLLCVEDSWSLFNFLSWVKAWPYAHENHTKSPIWHKNTNARSSLREFKQNCLCWMHPMQTMDKKLQLMISTIWLVNRILATVIISFLWRLSVW